MDGQTVGRTDRRMDRRTNADRQGQKETQTVGTDRQVDRPDRQTERWMDGQTDLPSCREAVKHWLKSMLKKNRFLLQQQKDDMGNKARYYPAQKGSALTGHIADEWADFPRSRRRIRKTIPVPT